MISDAFLEFTDQVEILPSARGFSIFTTLYDADKSVKKGLYRSQLNYLYYVWTRTSPFFSRYTPEERENLFFTQIEKANPKKIKTPELESAIRVFIRHTLTQTEGQLQQIYADFDRFLQHLNAIPWDREEVIVTKEGKKEIIKSRKVSNMEERMKAISNAKTILELQKTLEKLVKEENKARAKGNVQVRKYEDRETVESMNSQILQNGKSVS